MCKKIMTNYFSMEIQAPKGLTGIEKYLSKCKLDLEPWISGYNNKVILRSKVNAPFNWSMNSSDDVFLYAAGEMFNGIDETILALESLSKIFKNMNLPHQILIDDKNKYLYKTINYEWVEEKNT